MILEFGPEAPWWLRALASTALVAHISGGTMGMISGGVAMFAPKGARLHRVAGTVFFISMLTMAGVAAIVAPMLDDPWTNTTAAVFTLYLVATAWGTVRRPPGRIGKFERVAMVAPLGIAAMGLGLAIAGTAVPGSEDFATVYIFAFVSALAASADLSVIRRGGLTGVARDARHLWRMSAALFVATGSCSRWRSDRSSLTSPARSTACCTRSICCESSVSIRSMVRVGGGAPAMTIRTVPLPGIGPSHVVAASRIALATAGAPHITVTPC